MPDSSFWRHRCKKDQYTIEYIKEEFKAEMKLQSQVQNVCFLFLFFFYICILNTYHNWFLLLILLRAYFCHIPFIIQLKHRNDVGCGFTLQAGSAMTVVCARYFSFVILAGCCVIQDKAHIFILFFLTQTNIFPGSSDQYVLSWKVRGVSPSWYISLWHLCDVCQGEGMACLPQAGVI